MKWRMIVFLAVFVGVAAVSWSMLNDHPAATMGAASAKQANLGKILYGQHCASCHGVNLEGQQNW
jgi:mono/diheme cytochrome c family protein